MNQHPLSILKSVLPKSYSYVMGFHVLYRVFHWLENSDHVILIIFPVVKRLKINNNFILQVSKLPN